MEIKKDHCTKVNTEFYFTLFDFANLVVILFVRFDFSIILLDMLFADFFIINSFVDSFVIDSVNYIVCLDEFMFLVMVDMDNVYWCYLVNDCLLWIYEYLWRV